MNTPDPFHCRRCAGGRRDGPVPHWGTPDRRGLLANYVQVTAAFGYARALRGRPTSAW